MENNEEYVTTSLQGYTKRSGLNRGRSPRYSVLNGCLEGSTSPLVKIRQGVVIIRTLPIICGAHQFHSFLPFFPFFPLFLLSLLSLKKWHLQPEQFVAVRTHKNQDKPLAVDASLLRAFYAVAVWKPLSKLRYFQTATPSPYGLCINRKAINMK